MLFLLLWLWCWLAAGTPATLPWFVVLGLFIYIHTLTIFTRRK